MGKASNISINGVIFLIFIFLFATTTGFSQEKEEKKIALGFTIGGLISLADVDFDNEFEEKTANVTLESLRTRDGFAFGIQFRYSFVDWLSAGANIDYGTVRIVPEIKVDDTFIKENFGRGNTLSLMVVGELRLPADVASRELFSPYFSLGLGFNYHVWQDPKDSDFNVDVDPSFLFVVSAGVECYLTPSTTILCDLGYHYDNAGFEINSHSIKRYSGDLDLSDIRITFGIRSYL